MKHLAALAKRGIEVWIKSTGRLGLKGPCSPELREQISLRKSAIIGEILLGAIRCPTCGATVILQRFDDADDGWRWWECGCGEYGGKQLTPWQVTMNQQGWVVVRNGSLGERVIVVRDNTTELPRPPAVPVWTLEELIMWMCSDPATRETLVSLKTQHGGQVLSGMKCPFSEAPNG